MGGKQRPNERARQQNEVQEDVVDAWCRLHQAASSSHQQEVAEALGLASHRWNQPLAMEEQVVREEQNLAGAAEEAPIAAG
jgi:hypothetical protein